MRVIPIIYQGSTYLYIDFSRKAWIGRGSSPFLEVPVFGFVIRKLFGTTLPRINGNFRILNWRYLNVPYFGPYELWGYSLKFRPYMAIDFTMMFIGLDAPFEAIVFEC